MKQQKFYNNWYFLALLWWTLNLVQSCVTPLIDDEAYYWLFSNQLDWGYFDHPPMIALFIKAGYSLFANELGVRLAAVTAQVLFLRIVWSFIDHPQKSNFAWLFFAIAFCIPMLTVYGFITTPDVPLLFFGSLTLWAYRRFLTKDNALNIMLFAVFSAALMYSKYHGALLLIALMIANRRLLLQPTFYLVGVLAVLLFLPHILWQWNQDFVSFQYHFVDRVSVRSAAFIPLNLLNQFLVYNPLLWFFFAPAIYVAWQSVFQKPLKIDSETIFKRSLVMVFVVFLGFSILFSLRLQRIEAHWTVMMSAPLIVFLFDFLLRNWLSMQRFRWVSRISLVLLLGARLVFIFVETPLVATGLQHIETVNELKTLANGRQVIHLNSYQKAALFGFYNPDKKTYSLNTLGANRKNQFDVWDNTSELNGQNVLFVEQRRRSYLSDTMRLANGEKIFYQKYDNYLNTSKLVIETDSSFFNKTLLLGDTIQVNCLLSNPYIYDIPMNRLWFKLGLFKNNRLKKSVNVKKLGAPKTLKAKTSIPLTLEFVVPKQKGDWQVNWLLQLNDNSPKSTHGEMMKIQILER